jgi:hypothetical protein
MKTLAIAAAAASLSLGFAVAPVVPALATTADVAQCANARGSGSLNDIKLFCGRSELPSTVVRPGTIFKGMVFNRSSGRNVGDAHFSLQQMNCNQARQENSQANIAFFCK